MFVRVVSYEALGGSPQRSRHQLSTATECQGSAAVGSNCVLLSADLWLPRAALGFPATCAMQKVSTAKRQVTLRHEVQKNPSRAGREGAGGSSERTAGRGDGGELTTGPMGASGLLMSE